MSDAEATTKVAVFLQGGRFNGDRGAIVAPAPPVLYATPCDCSPLAIDKPCGQASHWHDVALEHELGDAARHGSYYAKVHEQPAPSGMTAALYWYAGTVEPSERERTRVLREFQRAQARRNGPRNGAART